MNKINNKTLTILSAITIALSLIGFLGIFMVYRDYMISGSGLIFSMPPFIEIFVGLIALVLPILMTIYSAKYNADNATIIVRILLILTAVYQLSDTIYLYTWHVLSRFLLSVPFLIFIIIAAFSSFGKSKNKKIIILAIALGILYKILSVPTILSQMIRHLSHKGWLFLFSLPCEWAGIVGFYATFILFCFKSGVVSLKPASPANKKSPVKTNLSPEDELKALKEKADLGMISQEEYQAKRAEIISKL